ncbi:MAG: UPF0158 family protein [Arenicellales bacterium]
MPGKTARLDELVDALAYVSGGAFMGSEAYLCISTGKILYRSDDFEDEEDPLPEDIDESDDYVAIPDKNDLDLGKDLVFRFVRQSIPDAIDDVEDIFRRKGAYGRFKNMLERYGVLERWYEYEEAQGREALKRWCTDNGIAFTE